MLFTMSEAFAPEAEKFRRQILKLWNQTEIEKKRTLCVRFFILYS